MNRPDLLWAVNSLAREITKWNKACDKRLHRLIAYLRSTSNWVQKCWVGDPPEDCWLAMFCDASFAGDLRDSKSTSGMYLCLVGPNTFVPITWFCKKQGAVSHSTTEAEMIALETATRLEGLTSLALWDLVIEVLGTKNTSVQSASRKRMPTDKAQSHGQQVLSMFDVDYVPTTAPPPGEAKLVILEDNDVVIKVTIKGRSTNLNHVPRTHRIFCHPANRHTH